MSSQTIRESAPMPVVELWGERFELRSDITAMTVDLMRTGCERVDELGDDDPRAVPIAASALDLIYRPLPRRLRRRGRRISELIIERHAEGRLTVKRFSEFLDATAELLHEHAAEMWNARMEVT